MAAGLQPRGPRRPCARRPGSTADGDFTSAAGRPSSRWPRSLLLSDPAAAPRVARVGARADSPGIGRRRLAGARGGGRPRRRACELGRRGPGWWIAPTRIAAELRARRGWRPTLRWSGCRRRGCWSAGVAGGAATPGAGVRDRRTPLAVGSWLARPAWSSTRRAGPGGAALAEVRAGLDELHAWQSTFGSLDLQTSWWAGGGASRSTGWPGGRLDGARRWSSSGPSGRGCWPPGSGRSAPPADVQLRRGPHRAAAAVGGEDGWRSTDQRRARRAAPSGPGALPAPRAGPVR